ncbi:MAG: branched-chain amino acid ABC transporter permease, partial [Actinomycetota bacterium]|nr:branched-chain amino acid ABC transporter permease [Actinomycetota bacterium]
MATQAAATRAPAAARAPGVKAPASPMQRAVRGGLLGGAIVIYLALVGMVHRFDEREVITGFLNLGPAFLYLVYLVAGYLAAKDPTVRHGEEPPPPTAPATRLLGGALGGAIAGALTGALLLLGSGVDLSSMFVSMTNALFDILSFGQSAAIGALLRVVVGAILGVAGAGLLVLSPTNRRPLIVGLTTMFLISLAEPLLRVMLLGLNIDSSWLYESGGLTLLGAVLVFVVATGTTWWWARRGDEVKERVEKLPAKQRQGLKIGGFVALLAFLLVLPQIVGPFLSEVIGTVGLFVLLGLGLNIVIGYAGLLDLGYVAFFAIGAYATAILTSPSAVTGGPLVFWTSVVFVVLTATLAGILIGAPVLRLRGDYLAIVTLGFGEIVRILVISNWLKPLTGGAQGILSIPPPTVGGFEFDDPQSLYYLILICCIAAAFISARLQESRIGRAWVAMREDEQVAEAMGISIIKTKLLAFAMGAAIGSFGGLFFAVKIGSVFPHSMNILVSIQVLALIVLGGMGSIRGVIIGAFVLVGLPELLRE